MTIRRSSGRLPILLLGAANGALYTIIMFVVISVGREYVQSQYVREATRLGAPIVQFGSNERWIGIAVAMIFAFALSAYLVRRLCQGRLSPLLFWEVVGVIAVAGWNVFMLTLTWFEKESAAQALTYNWVTSRSNWLYGPISLGAVILINFLYGTVVRVLERPVYR